MGSASASMRNGRHPRPDRCERERRTDAGFTFAGPCLSVRAADRENIAGAATAALGAMMAGAEAVTCAGRRRQRFRLIAADNELVPMDAQTAFAFGQAAMAHKSRLIFQARALKDARPIPTDFTDDRIGRRQSDQSNQVP